MRGFLRSLFSPRTDASEEIAVIRRRERELGALDEHGLRAAFRNSKDLLEAIAIVCVVASRVLQLEMFDVQLQGALGARARTHHRDADRRRQDAGLHVPAVAWLARGGRGVHVMTVNDYLARRDAALDGRHLRISRASPSAASSRRWRPRRAARRTPATSPTPPPTRSASTCCAISWRCALEDQVHRAVPRGRDRRGRFHPDRRSAHSAGAGRRRGR